MYRQVTNAITSSAYAHRRQPMMMLPADDELLGLMHFYALGVPFAALLILSLMKRGRRIPARPICRALRALTIRRLFEHDTISSGFSRMRSPTMALLFSPHAMPTLTRRRRRAHARRRPQSHKPRARIPTTSQHAARRQVVPSRRHCRRRYGAIFLARRRPARRSNTTLHALLATSPDWRTIYYYDELH